MPLRLSMRAATGMLLLGFGFATCAQSDSKDAPLVANAADGSFMAHAAADDMAEIHMGQMALEKPADARMKQLAQRSSLPTPTGVIE